MKTIIPILSLLSLLLGTQLGAAQFKALVFADSFDQWHFRTVPVAKESFEMLAAKHFFEMKFVDTDKDFGKETFADYDIIVFISANPCELNDNKRKEFEAYVHNGGAIVGVHSSSATANEPNRWLG